MFDRRGETLCRRVAGHGRGAHGCDAGGEKSCRTVRKDRAGYEGSFQFSVFSFQQG